MTGSKGTVGVSSMMTAVHDRKRDRQRGQGTGSRYMKIGNHCEGGKGECSSDNDSSYKVGGSGGCRLGEGEMPPYIPVRAGWGGE